MTPAEIEQLREAASGDQSVLALLSDDQKLAAAMKVVEIEDERYATDPYAWAVEKVMTIDEAAKAVKAFPDKMYLHDYFDVLNEQQLIAVPKSRREMVTWGTAVYMTHQARYQRHYAGFVQSDTETKSAYVVDKRMKFIEDNLPVVYRRPYTSVKTVSGLVGQVTYGGGSFNKAIAQGADAFRTYTPSFVFMDEIESQEQGHQSFVAALPFAEKECKIVLVGSSGGPHGVLADMARLAGFRRFA